MEINEFIDHIRSVSANFKWIKNVSVEKKKVRVRIRLLMNHDFVDVFYDNVQKHVPDKPVTIETFLKSLENELRKRNKIR